MEKQTLENNGMMLISEQNSAAHSVAISLYLRGGPAYESSGCRGISHLAEHMFFRTLGAQTQKDIYEQLRLMGTMMYATTYIECINFRISVLPKHLKKAFAILDSILKQQNWSSADISLEKKVVIKQIEEKGYPGSDEYASRLSYGCYPWTAKIMGSASSVKRISRKQLLAWQKIICNPPNVCFVITGNFTDDDLQFVKMELGKHPQRGEPLRRFSYLPPQIFHRSHLDDVILEMDDTVADVSISFDVPQNMQNYANLFSCILGNIGSRISMELREACAMVSDIATYVDHNVAFSRFYFVFSVDNTDSFECMTKFFNILGGMDKALDKKELTAAIEYWDRTSEMLNDNPEGLNEELAWHVFVTGPEMDFDYKNLTLQNFQDAARAIFSSENMFVVVDNNEEYLSRQKLNRLLRQVRFSMRRRTI